MTETPYTPQATLQICTAPSSQLRGGEASQQAGCGQIGRSHYCSKIPPLECETTNVQTMHSKLQENGVIGVRGAAVMQVSMHSNPYSRGYITPTYRLPFKWQVPRSSQPYGQLLTIVCIWQARKCEPLRIQVQTSCNGDTKKRTCVKTASSVSRYRGLPL